MSTDLNGKMFIKSADGAGFVSIGEVQALKITLKNGHDLYMGKTEGIFDLKLTEDDKALMSGMKIGPKR